MQARASEPDEAKTLFFAQMMTEWVGFSQSLPSQYLGQKLKITKVMLNEQKLG